MIQARSIAAVFLFATFGCLSSLSTAPGVQIAGEGRRVLFIGNSYLYYGEIPEIVRALADSAHGDKLAVAIVAGPDLSLIDHYQIGDARNAIKKGGWEWVILQQGPSSVDLNRDTLILATRLFAADMRPVKARPALFSAWPSEPRSEDFARAVESYRLAAQDVQGVFLPVAAAWLAAWKRDPTLSLYADGLHPSTLGSYLSALVVYAGLLGKSPVGLPSTLRLGTGRIVTIDPAVAAVLQAAAADAIGQR